ncbi:alpha/beta hydrolase family protein [Curtobacterium sp. ISL-83]|uniref:alpha/beta hydrolase family protein n=1 Tax=Curtobacterium sp. ISL-83 TaxID=2819145 RepID=UPI001BE63CF8|nr:alpha/beta hydrolase family protein [Curtobacterium sp. ISL-83]MBT2503900.1 alpha/beta fold hydrolase [Curtobacterium sp. ISL-83]
MTVLHGWAGRPAIRVAAQLPPAARAGVVICPPLGQEGVIAYRTLRLLADRLEARGIASVRYDPSGRGDAAADAAPDAQVRSARRAAAVLRSTGVERIAFVGLASAALVAAAAADEADALVLWDAPASGRAWLRKQRALATITIHGDRVLGEVESLIGIDVQPDEAAYLHSLGFAPRTGPTIALVRPGTSAPRSLGTVPTTEVTGSGELLDGTSMHARIPGAAVDTVVAWLDAWAPEDTRPTVAPELVEVLDVDDRVSERIVRMGPEALFGIETVASGQAADAPVVVLHNGAAEHRVGATDYQVELARALARDGARVVRFDRRGTGESTPVSEDERTFLFAQEWIDDQAAVVAALGAPSDRLVLAGMCAGAWLAGRGAEDAPRLVVEISPNDYRRSTAAPGSYVDALRAIDEPSALRLWVRERYNTVVPKAVRDRIARRDRAGGVLGHVRPLVEHGTDVVMIVAPDDAELFDRLGGQRAVRRYPGHGRNGSVDVVRVPDGDHSLFSPVMREAVLAEVRARVAATFPVHA